MMSEITPPQPSMVWKPSIPTNPIEGFAEQPILGAAYSDDDPVQGLMINTMVASAAVFSVSVLGGGVIPLALACTSSLMLIASDGLLQIRRINDVEYQKAKRQKKDAIAVEFEDVTPEPVEPEAIAKPEPVKVEAPEPAIAQPPVTGQTPIVETPTVTTSEWDLEAAEEVAISNNPTIPDLKPTLTPEQIKATEFAQRFLGNGRVWSAEQLAVKHSMTSEQWVSACNWIGLTLPQEYVWEPDIKVLVKL